MECYDPRNPLELQYGDEEDLARKYFDVEVDFMVHPGYRTDDRFIAIRYTALSAIVKYTCDQHDAFVPYLAINYVDRFLSTNINIPVILNGQGVKRNVELFAFSCVSIASKIRSSDFSVSDLLKKHQLAEVKDDVEIMELHIMEGLNQRVRPVTAITFMYFLLPDLLIKEVQQQPFPTTFAARIIFHIHKDIRFTEFRPSTLAASAILASTYEILPGSHSQFFKKISGSSFVIQSEVEECFNLLIGVPDHIPNPGLRPRVSKFKKTNRWRSVGRSKTEIAEWLNEGEKIEMVVGSILPEIEERPLNRKGNQEAWELKVQEQVPTS